MILHIKFIDGSNPFVSYGDKAQLLKAWKQYRHITTARPLFMTDNYKCMPISGGGWAVGRYSDGAHTTYKFERIGNALNAMERMEKNK